MSQKYVQKLTCRPQRARTALGTPGMTPDCSAMFSDDSGLLRVSLEALWRLPMAAAGSDQLPQAHTSQSELPEDAERQDFS